MDLDRGVLAKIDRRILSGLGHDERYQMVRVPLSEAMWSTWRRYCAALGVSMGRGIAELIAHELGATVGKETDGGTAFAGDLQRQLIKRFEDLDAQERRLYEKERSLRAAERLLQARTMPLESYWSAGTNPARVVPASSTSDVMAPDPRGRSPVVLEGDGR